MELGTVLSVAQTLYGALQSSELKELCSVWGYESELENLGCKVSVVNAVLLDAESKREQVELSHQAQLWVDELKDVVFDADDLLDEFVTLVEQKQLMDREGGNVFKMARHFFSRSNPLLVALNMSRGIKDIRDRWDAIAGNHADFGFKLDCHPIRRRRDETCSYVYANNIIGREQDKENIISLLLDSEVKRDVSFLTIVGIGGLGKTALAQLVYNDPRVEKQFPLRLWACVAEVQKYLGMKPIIVKILQSATGRTHGELMEKNLQCLREELQKQLAGKKCFIVLDDFWNENRHICGKVMELFMSVSGGSWILMTTRSKITAEVVGDGLTYELKELSEEDSWHLFEVTAFGQGPKQESTPDLVNIGREIVQKCANVPLAIRVVGSLLYGHSIEKWQSFQQIGIGRIRQGEEGIEPILTSSYLHLEAPLRICFSYCALFPKDYILGKDMLISLWMALGYIIPLEEGQNIEDAGEEYFSILLRRCFFQNVEKDEYGEVVSCKMHALMHDIAQKVAGKEIHTGTLTDCNSDKKVRHFFQTGTTYKFPGFPSTGNKIRTCLLVSKSLIRGHRMSEMFQSWTCLRALDLSYLGVLRLPKETNRLIHLRYLDLSGNHWLRALPASFTELHNLQTLKLRGCKKLSQLPEDMGRLVKLRSLDLNGLNIKLLPSTMDKLSQLAHLDLSGNDKLEVLPESIKELSELRTLRLRCCDSLRDLSKDVSKLAKLRVLDVTGCSWLNNMPCGIGKLTSLQILPLFVVGENSSTTNTHIVDMLDELKALTNLNGHLEIHLNISGNTTYVRGNGGEGGYLRNKRHLMHIVIEFRSGWEIDDSVDYEEALLEDLQPHSNLKGLRLSGYSGEKIPSWATEHFLPIHLPNLVKVHLVLCDGLQSLTSFGKLSHLKSLKIEQLSDLEYIENTPGGSCDDAGVSESESEPFFPALEDLMLEDLPKLRGWWTDDMVHKISKQESGPFFPRLIDLRICGCPNLTYIPLCPTIERLNLGKIDPRLRIMESESTDSTLRSVYTEDIVCLSSALSVEAFRCLGKMEIRFDDNVKSLSEAGELFQRCSTPLQSLIINRCWNLESVCEGLLHLSALETLNLIDMRRLDLSDCGDSDREKGKSKLSDCGDSDREKGKSNGMPWICLHRCLRSLSLEYLPRLVYLPDGMRYLSSLQFLFIKSCERLRSVPYFMRQLKSLKQLEITGCSSTLKKRCRNPSGQDWPNIQHIPHVFVTTFGATDSSEDNDSDFSSDSSSAHCL